MRPLSCVLKPGLCVPFIDKGRMREAPLVSSSWLHLIPFGLVLLAQLAFVNRVATAGGLLVFIIWGPKGTGRRRLVSLELIP